MMRAALCAGLFASFTLAAGWSVAAEPASRVDARDAARAGQLVVTAAAEEAGPAEPTAQEPVVTSNMLPVEIEPSQAPQLESEKPIEDAKPAVSLPPTLDIDINLTSQRMTVTENGVMKFTWPVSSGAYGYATPTGTFKPVWMAKMWYSRQYDMAPMPHSIFFHGGVAIHATYSTSLLGRPASHGCVRLSPKNAATLYTLVSKHGKERTRIVVHGKPNYAAPKIAKATPPRDSTVLPRSRTRTVYSAYGYGPYGYSPYASVAPRYVYPGDQRYYYVPADRLRAQQMRKRPVNPRPSTYFGYGY